jgi:hypothetical protein
MSHDTLVYESDFLNLPSMLSARLSTLQLWFDPLRGDATAWYCLVAACVILVFLIVLRVARLMRSRRQIAPVRVSDMRSEPNLSESGVLPTAISDPKDVIKAAQVEAVLLVKNAISTIYSVNSADPVVPVSPVLASADAPVADAFVSPSVVSREMPRTANSTSPAAVDECLEQVPLALIIQACQQQLKIQSSALLIQGERILALETALEHMERRQQHAEEERHRLENYDEAIALAAKGIDADTLMSRFNLSASEAELITLLHGRRNTT